MNVQYFRYIQRYAYSILLAATDNNVLEVLNVYVNENNVKKLIFLEGFFFPSSEKLTFEIENVIFLKYFFKILIYFI